MGYECLIIRSSYSSDEGRSILHEFYNPVLEESCIYKRAVGYFNSKLLLYLVNGIKGLIKNDGIMKLIVSPELEEKDIIAIKEGYELKELLSNKFLKDLDENSITLDEIDNLMLLKQLVSEGILEIKIAFMKDYGIYHEKIGILTDINEKKIAFTGSLNETYAGVFNNYESIDVFKSWIPSEIERIIEKEMKFDRLWSDEDPQVNVINFPNVVISKSIENLKEKLHLQRESTGKYKVNTEGPYAMDPNFKLRDYQLEAIINWKRNDFKGLFAMATGTGKTLSAISALEFLWNKDDNPLFVVIVCPYTHLVEQWIEDLVKFNITPVIAYSNYNWENALKNDIRSTKYGLKEFACVITTNSTYLLHRFQEIIKTINIKQLLIVDEAHNFGSSTIRELYNESIDYRLALSATPIRYFDDEGTLELIKYFDKVVYELTLKDAIDKGFLTQYYYYPKIVYLNDDEYEQYKELSLKISKIYAFSDKEDGGNETLDTLLIKRSRILNLAENKLVEFKELIVDRRDTFNNLVYCAAGTMYTGERQIDAISNLLGNTLNMDIHRFTAEEDMETRSNIIRDFQEKKSQCIVAIKCLDEGVNIPSIETAYILASSGNEKEFIQRRGRVLRKFPGKNYAKIYDLIVLPRKLNEVPYCDDKIRKLDKAIIMKELKRIKEFTDLSLNKYEGEKLITSIETAYELIY